MSSFALAPSRGLSVAGGLPEGPDGFVSRPFEGGLFGVVG